MDSIVVVGGKPLYGTVTINGAKNAVLPILAATVLYGGTYILQNCPDISDVSDAVEILKYLGGTATRSGTTLIVHTEQLQRWSIPPELTGRMRASILFLGSLLGRFGKAELAVPGGCPLGSRPIDLHLYAMTQMGASVTLQEGWIFGSAGSLRSCEITFPIPSVGATENVLLAASASEGTVILKNAAREPDIADLIRFLQKMGADIRGTGTGTLTIRGGLSPGKTVHNIMPDRIETATFLCAVAACGGNVLLTDTMPSAVMPVTQVLRVAGCEINQETNRLRVRSDGCLTGGCCIVTAPYPAFPTDAQAIVMAAMLRARGRSMFSETVFEARMGHVAQLRRFGGQIDTAGTTAVVHGVARLYGASVEAGDLRAAAALLVAALQTPQESVIHGIKHLHRGYYNLEEKLIRIGAEIKR